MTCTAYAYPPHTRSLMSLRANEEEWGRGSRTPSGRGPSRGSAGRNRSLLKKEEKKVYFDRQTVTYSGLTLRVNLKECDCATDSNFLLLCAENGCRPCPRRKKSIGQIIRDTIMLYWSGVSETIDRIDGRRDLSRKYLMFCRTSRSTLRFKTHKKYRRANDEQ